MLKRDLEAAGIPFETAEGRLDFHALRTAYINFLMDVEAAPKTMQSLARHETLEMTMNVYGRAREDKRREAVEALGQMLMPASNGLTATNNCLENYRISTEPREGKGGAKNITSDEIGGYIKNNWCGREDLKPRDSKVSGWTPLGHKGTNYGQEVLQPGQYQGDTQGNERKGWSPSATSWTPECKPWPQQSTNRLQTIYQQSLVFLTMILRDPQLKAFLIFWQKNLNLAAKGQIMRTVYNQ